VRLSRVFLFIFIVLLITSPLAFAFIEGGRDRVSSVLPAEPSTESVKALPNHQGMSRVVAVEAAPLPTPQTPPGAPFPRLSAFTWGGGVADYYAHFDLLDWSNNNPADALAIKAINPDIKIVVTRDINSGLGLKDDKYPDAWKTRSSTGEFCTVYGGMAYYADYTNFAPRLAEYGNKRFNEFVADYYLDLVDLSVFDGVATDGLWENYWGEAPCNSDIDLDRNGINDYNEHGRGWVSARIEDGAVTTVENIRSAIGDGKLLIVNSGGPHLYGMQSTNGFIHEHFTGVYGFDWFKNRYDTFIEGSATPSMPIVNADTIDGSPVAVEKNDLQRMRYGLGFALLTGAYFDFTDYGRAGEHYWLRYYDEFDVDLGYPTGPAQKIPSGAWIRFFDNGMIIINGSDLLPVTVTIDEIKDLPGYNPGHEGKYWRLLGGQDLSINGSQAVNNGKPFDEANPILLSLRQSDPTQSDAILLTRDPQVVVSDIVIDNADSGTSPGSASPGDQRVAEMPGFLQATDCNDGDSYYTVRCAVYQDPNTSPPDTTYLSPPFAWAEGGSDAHASFTPSIGVPGRYEVFEWHGTLAQGQPASNARLVLEHAFGTTEITIDQSHDAGRWNSLGVFPFNAGTQGKIALSAQDAQGTVLADAFKWVYRGATEQPTFTDVPLDHWAYDYIETLYQGGYIAGCNSEPLMYCPEDSMTRAESAVFVERGLHGANFIPPVPTKLLFEDVPLGEWFAKWATALYEDGYTAGCGTDPLRYCPLQQHTIAEGAVFYLRMMYGRDYTPPPEVGIFSDVPLEAWYAPWIEAAYAEGLIIPCQAEPNLSACPLDPLTRAMGAFMMVQAKGLTSPPQ
jgi:hypothetical protein